MKGYSSFVFFISQSLQTGETEKQNLKVVFVYRYDKEPFNVGIFPMGEIPFCFSIRDYGLYRTEYAYENPQNSFFVSGNPYYAPVFTNFPSLSKLFSFLFDRLDSG
jgi:hypothetical protein